MLVLSQYHIFESYKINIYNVVTILKELPPTSLSIRASGLPKNKGTWSPGRFQMAWQKWIDLPKLKPWICTINVFLPVNISTSWLDNVSSFSLTRIFHLVYIKFTKGKTCGCLVKRSWPCTLCKSFSATGKLGLAADKISKILLTTNKQWRLKKDNYVHEE